MKLGAIAIAAALVLVGCGGSDDGDHGTTAAATGPGPTRTPGEKVTGELPQGAVGPADSAEQAAEGPAAAEASPEAPAVGPSASGDLPDADRSAVSAVARDYVAALDRHEAARVCALIAPAGMDLSDLPERRGGCRASLRASIGSRPPGGGPAWRRTQIVSVAPERLGDDRARVTATAHRRPAGS